MVRVVWTRESLAQLVSIRSYIRQFNPAAAERLSARLVETGESLSDFPKRGRPISGSLRELTIIPPYLIRYQVEEHRVIILRVRHGARLPR